MAQARPAAVPAPSSARPPQGHADAARWPALESLAGDIKRMDDVVADAYLFGPEPTTTTRRARTGRRREGRHAEDGAADDARGATAGAAVDSWLAPWQPSELAAVDDLARLAGVTRDSVVLDLGCGDGRAVLWLAKTRGCAAVGWDAAPECVATAARLRDADADVPRERTAFRCVDFATPEPLADERGAAAADARRATVAYAYLLREGLLRVRATLERVADLAPPGLVLVTNTYHFRDGEFWPCVGELGALKAWRRPCER